MKKLLFLSATLLCATPTGAFFSTVQSPKGCQFDILDAVRSGDAARIAKAYRECKASWITTVDYSAKNVTKQESTEILLAGLKERFRLELEQEELLRKQREAGLLKNYAWIIKPAIGLATVVTILAVRLMAQNAATRSATEVTSAAGSEVNQ